MLVSGAAPRMRLGNKIMIKFSYHRYINGKPETKIIDGKKYLYTKGRKLNLGFDWLNSEAEYDDIFDLLTVDGIAISPYLNNLPRSAANFASCELALVDIDSGMTIEQLLENEFYNEFAAGFYTTPSHTDSDHRFRIIHILETAITEPEKMRKLYRGLMLAYGNADQSCKDPARLFFGTVNAPIKEKRDAVLTDTAVSYLIEMIEQLDAEELHKHEAIAYKPLDDRSKKLIIDKLKSCFVGEYSTWRNIGWGLKAGGFRLEDFQYVTTGMMNQKTAEDAKKVWDKGSSNGKVTMGTVIHFLKQRYGENFNLSRTPSALRITNTNKI